MQCRYPKQMRHPTTGIWLTYPCSYCFPCRINKQSEWELRNRLECLTSLTSSFWTLTIAPSQMDEWASHPPGHHLRRFFANLRYFENRTGGQSLTRYFGCLEYGETYGRPHYHLLMYNLTSAHLEPIPRKNGMPASHYQLKLWPFGHIDVGTVTPASIRYVSSYLTKESSLRPATLFRTSQPGIGYYGLRKLVEELVNKHGRLIEMPAYFQIGERKFGLGDYCRKTFRRIAETEFNAKIKPENPHQKVVQRVQLDQAKLLADHYTTEAKKAQDIERRIDEQETKKRIREIEISQRYAKIVSDPQYSRRQNAAFADAENLTHEEIDESERQISRANRQREKTKMGSARASSPS